MAGGTLLGHFFWHFIIFAFVLLFQLTYFLSAREIINIFNYLFSFVPELDQNSFELKIKTEKSVDEKVKKVHFRLVSNINKYLKNNKHRDINIVKDIIERENLSLQNQIIISIPKPLYVGLLATFLGVIIALLPFLFASGEENATSLTSAIPLFLGGVAITMSGSFSGLLLTLANNSFYRKALEKNEKEKIEFLSFLESKLFPEIASDAFAVIRRVRETLDDFNKKFADSSAYILDISKESFELQKEFLETVRTVNINDLIKDNIKLFHDISKNLNKFEKTAIFINKFNETLETSIEIGKTLNSILSRVAYFEETIKRFNDNVAVENTAVSKYLEFIQRLFEDTKQKKEIIEKILLDSNDFFAEAAKKQQEELTNAANNAIVHLQTLNEKLSSNFELLANEFENKLREITLHFYKKLEDVLQDATVKSLWDNLNNLAILPQIADLAQNLKTLNTLAQELAKSIEELSHIKNNVLEFKADVNSSFGKIVYALDFVKLLPELLSETKKTNRQLEEIYVAINEFKNMVQPYMSDIKFLPNVAMLYPDVRLIKEYIETIKENIDKTDDKASLAKIEKKILTKEASIERDNIITVDRKIDYKTPVDHKDNNETPVDQKYHNTATVEYKDVNEKAIEHKIDNEITEAKLSSQENETILESNAPEAILYDSNKTQENISKDLANSTDDDEFLSDPKKFRFE